MAKLTWRPKLVAQFDSGAASKTEVVRLEREDFAVPEAFGHALRRGCTRVGVRHGEVCFAGSMRVCSAWRLNGSAITALRSNPPRASQHTMW